MRDDYFQIGSALRRRFFVNMLMRAREIFEAISFSQARPMMAANNSSVYDDLFQRFAKYARGKKNPQRLYFPLRTRDDESSQENAACADRIFTWAQGLDLNLMGDEVNKRLAPVVKSLRVMFDGIDSIDLKVFDQKARTDYDNYRRGYFTVISNGKGRQVRIGKLFEKLKEYYKKTFAICQEITQRDGVEARTIDDFMKNSFYNKELFDHFISEVDHHQALFQNDSSRTLQARPGSYTVIISRHPYDIAGMSTGRGWTSCTNLEDGSDRRYVIEYVKGSSLIAYLVRDGDWNIQNPVARQLLCRYNRVTKKHAEQSTDDYVLWPQDNYGAKSESFDRTVELFCKIANRGRDNGLYQARQQQQYPLLMRKEKNSVEHSF